MSRGGRWIVGLGVATALLCLPALFSLDYYLHIFVMAGIHAMLAISLGVIIGFTGQVSLCHAAFYGVGAYASALVSLNFGLSFWFAMWVGGLTAGVLSYALGRLVLRLTGHFLAITTAFFGVLVTVVLNNWVPLTKGPMGIPGIPRPSLPAFLGPLAAFESRVAYYYLVLVFVLGVAFASSAATAWSTAASTPLGRPAPMPLTPRAFATFEVSESGAAVDACFFTRFMARALTVAATPPIRKLRASLRLPNQPAAPDASPVAARLTRARPIPVFSTVGSLAPIALSIRTLGRATLSSPPPTIWPASTKVSTFMRSLNDSLNTAKPAGFRR